MNLTSSSNLVNCMLLPKLYGNTVHHLRKLPLQQSWDEKLVDRRYKVEDSYAACRRKKKKKFHLLISTKLNEQNYQASIRMQKSYNLEL